MKPTSSVRCDIGPERIAWLRSMGMNATQLLCATIDEQMRGTSSVSTALVRAGSDDEDDDDADDAKEIVIVQFGPKEFERPKGDPPPHGTHAFRSLGTRLLGRYRLADWAQAERDAQEIMPGCEVRCAFPFIALEARMPSAWAIVDYGVPGAVPQGKDRAPDDPLAPPKLAG